MNLFIGQRIFEMAAFKAVVVDTLESEGNGTTYCKLSENKVYEPRHLFRRWGSPIRQSLYTWGRRFHGPELVVPNTSAASGSSEIDAYNQRFARTYHDARRPLGLDGTGLGDGYFNE